MKIKNLIITHQGYTVSPQGLYCVFNKFGANSKNKFQVYFKCVDPSKPRGMRITGNHFIEYDMSQAIEGITYRQGDSASPKVIEGARLKGDTLYIDVHDYQNDFTECPIVELTDEFKYYDLTEASDLPTELTHTAVFPPPETKAEWVDRMERILAHCAQNFEAAMGSLYPQYYTRLHDAATAKPSTDYLVRQTNTSVHCRWQIGWFWERVDRIKRNLPTVYTQAKLEPMIQAVYENMKTPQHIKQFFHRHNTQEWSKLRNQSTSTRENKRHISAWDTDYTEGTNFADLTARSTIGGHLNEQTADASMFEYGVTEYTKAARHPNWDLITERVY